MESDWSSLELRKLVAPEIIFGRGARHMVNRYMHNLGVRKVLLVTDPGVYKAGWARETEHTLTSERIECVRFDEVAPNPTEESVMKGAALYLDKGCEAIVVVGGGSPIDCAKGIGIVSTNGNHILDYQGIDHVEASIPPLVCIPTTGGSAADVSQFAIITDTAKRNKIEIVSKAIVPDVTLNDPETLMTMDAGLTRATGVDTLVHAIESYVSNAHSPFSDLMVLEAIRIATVTLPSCLCFPQKLEYRTKMLFACVAAGLGFSNTGLGAVHALAHALAGACNCVHGDANATFLPCMIEENYDAAPERYNHIAAAMGVVPDDPRNPESCKALPLARIRNFMAEIGETQTISDFGVSKKDIPLMARHAYDSACLVTNPKPLELETIEELYDRAFEERIPQAA